MSRARPPSDREERRARGRIVLVAVGVLSLFAAAAVRATHLQIVQAAELQARAEEQRHRRLELLPARGDIRDRNGRELAKSIPGASVFADPSCLLASREELQKLCAAMELKVDEVKAALKQGGARFAWLKRRVPPGEAEAVMALGIPGVGIAREPQRTYPKKTLAGQALGFVGVDGRGLGGLEYRFDSLLTGKPRVVQAERDARGCLLLPTVPDPSDGRGMSLALTLDETIQHIAEEELARAVETSAARSGVVVVTDPKTGEILALAQAPAFNPNAVSASRAEDRKVKAVVDVYEPGSTLKTLFLGILLDQGLASPRDLVFCENGTWTVYGHTIHDHEPYGWLSLADVLKVSSNIGVAKLSEKISPSAFFEGLQRFGLGAATSVELGGESVGILPQPREWSKMTPRTMAYGQGISATALQVANAIAAVANGGIRMRPRLLRAILDQTGNEVEHFAPEVAGRALSADAAATLVRMMERVVDDGGTGTLARVPGYTVAGKTGTSWKPDPDGNGYLPNKIVASFAGFVPSRDPRISILVAVDEPTRGLRYGGSVAAPAFAEMARRILAYLRVAPEEGSVAEAAPVANRPRRGAAATLSGAMPDLAGLTMREALRRLEGAGVAIRLSLLGSGIAATQDPGPGSALTAGQACRIEFRPLL